MASFKYLHHRKCPVPSEQYPVSSLLDTLVLFSFSYPHILKCHSSSFVSPVDITPSLNMSDNFQHPSLFGTANSPQLSVPVVSDATSLAGNVCNLSRISTPAFTSTWPLPSTSGISFQPLTGTAYLYQHSSTPMLTGVTGQNHSCTSVSSCPSTFERKYTGHTKKKSSELRDFTVTLNQGTVPSMAVTPRYVDANAIVPLYPSLSGSLVQGTLSQIPHQESSILLPYQPRNQVYYYNQNTMGPLLFGEPGPCLQSYGSVTYTGSGFFAPQPEIVMTLQEVQPTDVLPPVSTSGIYYSVSAQPNTETNFQETNLGMETFLELQLPSQKHYQPEIAESLKKTIESQDAPLLSIEIPDIWQLQVNRNLRDKGQMELTGTIGGLRNIAVMVKDIHFNQIFNSFTDLKQSNVSTTTDIKSTETINEILLQENSMVTKHSTGQVQRNKHEALESVDGTPEVKVECQPPELLLEEEVTVCTIPSSDQASVNTDKHSDSKSPKAASSKVSKTKSHAQKETKRIRENHPKKCDETKQPGNKIKKEEKTSIPKTKHKRSHPELSQETFKRPRTNLGVQMWESVQVFHALGKKSEKKKELPSPKALRNASSTQETKSTPAVKSRLGIPHEGKGPKITQVKKRDRSESQCPSPTQDELPPPGKVKLVPLPFLAPEKPQARPVSRRPQSLASRRPTAPYRALPCSNTAQPTAVSRSQPATANTCFIDSTKTSQPIAAKTIKQGLTTTPQPSVSQSTVARPEPYKTSSSTSLQQKPVSTSGTKFQSPPKPQSQYLLQDFSRQPIPWRKPDIPGPVVSNPITKEQRPEREAMKRRAQKEREIAAQYTALGKLQFFAQRQRDMEVSQYYGYVM
ncbi:PREDICTED: uncharacterized protein C2orf78-like [Dipodomys ordii]|uniref:Uncharacterized protein C2orf78-like n=1 Tax=Dipodomys ordii TaxID=10020 RepID=A0A1S3GRB6_DIPOR|nr:PREDICTED: uncharacterized protein C2orf78-like [Dipodomys ordii]